MRIEPVRGRMTNSRRCLHPRAVRGMQTTYGRKRSPRKSVSGGKGSSGLSLPHIPWEDLDVDSNWVCGQKAWPQQHLVSFTPRFGWWLGPAYARTLPKNWWVDSLERAVDSDVKPFETHLEMMSEGFWKFLSWKVNAYISECFCTTTHIF